MDMFSRKDLFRLFAPLLVEQLLAVLVGMADVVMVAAVGETAVSGVALVDSISLLVIQVLSAMATGGAVVCSQYIGKKSPKQACRAAGQLVLITAALSLMIAAVAFIGNRHLLQLIFGAVEVSVMDNAQIYFWFTAMSYPFLALYNSGAALFRSMGNSRVSMKVSLAMNAINVVGNALCVFGLHMGVEGVAIPTLVSRMFAAVVMVILVQNPENSICVTSFSQLIPKPDMIKKILAVGIPSGLENGMFQFGKIALQSLVSTLGTASIAGYAVASNLVTFQYLPGVALGLGLITIVGQCVGAGKPEQAKMYTKKVLMINYGLAFVICAVMAVFRSNVVGIYNLSPEASTLAQNLLLIHSCGMVLWPLAFTVPHALRAGLDAKFTMMVSVFSMWMFRIGFSYVFVKGFHMGVLGIWYAMFVDWTFRLIVFVWRFKGFSSRVRQV
ncbi:MATE family efflux transporter [Clostridium sp. OM02-18AC]|uniref:MATE family efflux transporter n=1 Tax=Clostridium sp. OM02-18AC TaxID=2292311 RepID=UPI00267B975E